MYELKKKKNTHTHVHRCTTLEILCENDRRQQKKARHSLASPLLLSDNLYISAASCSPSLPSCNTALKEHSWRFSARSVGAFTPIKADTITAYVHLCGRRENEHRHSPQYFSLSQPRVFMCPHVYLLPSHCLSVWPCCLAVFTFVRLYTSSVTQRVGVC